MHIAETHMLTLWGIAKGVKCVEEDLKTENLFKNGMVAKLNKYQEALDFVKYSCPRGSRKWKRSIDNLQELLDKCVFINDSWKIEHNVADTFLIETPCTNDYFPQGVDYEQ